METLVDGPLRRFTDGTGGVPAPPLAVLAPRDGSHAPPADSLWRDTQFDAARCAATNGDGYVPEETRTTPPPRPSLQGPGARQWTVDGGDRGDLLRYIGLPDGERRAELVDALTSAPPPPSVVAAPSTSS